MKVCGLMINEIKKDTKDIVMAIHTRAIFKKVKLMVKGSIIGQMERYMMVNGAKESKMVMECGKEYLEIVTWANG